MDVGSYVIFETKSVSDYGPYYYVGRLAIQLSDTEWLIQPNNQRMGVQRVSLEKIWLAPEFMSDTAAVDLD